MKSYDICIIGFGTAGMLALSLLPTLNICIIDPYFDGGDLFRKWHSVESNTKLIKVVDALRLIYPNYQLPQKYSDYDLQKTTPLYIISELLKDFVSTKLKSVDLVQDEIHSLNYTEHMWYLNNTLKSKAILLCNGSKPKTLDCGIPTIPLEKALCKTSLSKYINANDNVILFGTSHSGTLVLENLESLNVKTVAVYNKETPFEFACDGHYDGIKEDAERIGRDILSNKYKNISLIPYKDIGSILKASKQATWSIYCIGFTQHNNINLCIDGIKKDISRFDGTTGKLEGCPGAWGFGIAYPSTAPDSEHVDVGIYSFVEHIQKQIVDIKHFLN